MSFNISKLYSCFNSFNFLLRKSRELTVSAPITSTVKDPTGESAQTTALVSVMNASVMKDGLESTASVILALRTTVKLKVSVCPLLSHFTLSCVVDCLAFGTVSWDAIEQTYTQISSTLTCCSNCTAK